MSDAKSMTMSAKVAVIESALSAHASEAGRIGLRNFISIIISKFKELNIVNPATAKAIAHLLYNMYCAPFTPDFPGINIDAIALSFIDSVIDKFFTTTPAVR